MPQLADAVAGLAVFAVASLAAVGLAQNRRGVEARAVQGVGAALLAPSTLALLTVGFPEGRERTRAVAYYGAVAGIGASLHRRRRRRQRPQAWNYPDPEVDMQAITCLLWAMGDVFKALADPTRRTILDELTDRDGQTLFEICARLASKHHLNVSRQAISQHLDLLEGAGLISTRREGRCKYHHLNTEPLEHLTDRWVRRQHPEER